MFGTMKFGKSIVVFFVEKLQNVKMKNYKKKKSKKVLKENRLWCISTFKIYKSCIIYKCVDDGRKRNIIKKEIEKKKEKTKRDVKKKYWKKKKKG